jgi:hypothetical protein
MLKPVKPIISRKGRLSTPLRVCASSQARGPRPGRKVKKSLNSRRCTTTPESSATSRPRVSQPTSQKPSTGHCSM